MIQTDIPYTRASSRHQHHEADLKSLQNLAEWMDSKFTIPGTSIKFGLDSLIGIIPGIGDTATVAVTAYIIGKAGKHDLPKHIRFKMVWNAFIDWLIGLIPFFGDIFDIGYKANKKNVAILIDYLNNKKP